MTQPVVIFAGPSLIPDDHGNFPQFRFVGPAARGDILRCLQQDQPQYIGLIDGVFEDQPAVLHKELLEALATGVGVYGASSMGALRAAELHTFGMIGVGQIFRDYHDGTRVSDADVAVIHGPAALGHPPLSLPQVDVVATLASLADRGHLTRNEAQSIARISDALFYKTRTWDSLAAAVTPAQTRATRLAALLKSAHVQAKRLDAIALLNRIAQDCRKAPPPQRPPFAPPLTPAYQRVRRAILDAPDLSAQG
jgi:hypothetical protein